MHSPVTAGIKRPALSCEADFQTSSPTKKKKGKEKERVTFVVRIRRHQRRRSAARKGRDRHLHAQEGVVIHLNDDVALQNGPRLTDIDVSWANYRDIDIGRERQIRKIARKAATLWKSCKTCLDRKKIWCENLPCGHMTNCRDCAPHMLKCAQCAKNILVSRPTQDMAWTYLVRSTDSGLFLEHSYELSYLVIWNHG